MQDGRHVQLTRTDESDEMWPETRFAVVREAQPTIQVYGDAQGNGDPDGDEQLTLQQAELQYEVCV